MMIIDATATRKTPKEKGIQRPQMKTHAAAKPRRVLSYSIQQGAERNDLTETNPFRPADL